MATLGALSQAWISAEASLPLGWQISGLWRFDDLWLARSLTAAIGARSVAAGGGATQTSAIAWSAQRWSIGRSSQLETSRAPGHRGR